MALTPEIIVAALAAHLARVFVPKQTAVSITCAGVAIMVMVVAIKGRPPVHRAAKPVIPRPVVKTPITLVALGTETLARERVNPINVSRVGFVEAPPPQNAQPVVVVIGPRTPHPTMKVTIVPELALTVLVSTVVTEHTLAIFPVVTTSLVPIQEAAEQTFLPQMGFLGHGLLGITPPLLLFTSGMQVFPMLAMTNQPMRAAELGLFVGQISQPEQHQQHYLISIILTLTVLTKDL